ncbi:hypothetical protein H2O73_16325 [Vibrio sp. 404]|uniref:DNA polymerase III subunit beta n=1 Tax=Vibrio marinisediminis TaxID=2758441 RepID=A0A7W2FTE9_9VIBR|nr:hypothetical protein [Vibrio marinisediminis]MBA5763931.1 hypothetical protein [Vibrio marinisediminis]
MKKLAIVSLTLALLAGCASPQVGWDQDEKVIINDAPIQLTSNLWLNKMPTIGELQEQSLHGALNLESSRSLPADITVESVSLRQGDDVWIIDGDDLEIRTHDENQWEVVFAWQFELDPNKTVDVALQLNHQDSLNWLVEKQVLIDTVY